MDRYLIMTDERTDEEVVEGVNSILHINGLGYETVDDMLLRGRSDLRQDDRIILLVE